ncbi:Brp/Blh family beta-carotene 15,15'-dioxygenase [Hymenobacter sp. 5516J-16]|uniref:Brp/Blh family beta-carotene 15,15'-dioxygenase n=1 Tax=Hymenobacter sp. 5516J-16 TaxID=2932253 RepID=UPI001FD5D896|nr:Brp/Blh family beta-carotene 15,15'-dioxygenase [Hymenobacter sp. 5516J-16]UOQ77781.1 Brp/Blh family beta-carotene 15,15'-dioxygenase [Hymenobacter sp. 5516J-16]
MAAVFFFGLTAWHWGSADAPAYPQRGIWLVHSLLRGVLLLALPAYFWPAETVGHVNGLLLLTGAPPAQLDSYAPGGLLGLVLAGHLGLWAYLGWQRLPGRWLRDVGEVCLLACLFSSWPPLLALGVYFVFWHSLQHILRLAPLLGYAAGPSRLGARGRRKMLFFARRAWPMLAASLVLLAGAHALGGTWLPAQNAWLGLVVLAASVVTVPHALLVTLVMDAPKWRARPHLAAGNSLVLPAGQPPESDTPVLRTYGGR